MSFSSDLDDLCSGVETFVVEVRRRAFGKMATRVIDRTPIKTGRARSEWQTTAGDVPWGTVGNRGPDMAKSEVWSALQRVPIESPIFLTNNAPYIERLEDGSSAQAPSGMVRVSAQYWDHDVDQAIDEVKL